VSDSWTALYLPNTEGIWAARYPPQMLASLGGLSAALIVWGFEGWRSKLGRKPADWPWPEFVVVLALFFAGWQRFLVEFLRAAPALIGPFHLGHLLSGLMILGAALIVAVRRKRVEQGDLAGMPQLRQQRLR
jgi:prolipoprotein diacylglyceryltransferase